MSEPFKSLTNNPPKTCLKLFHNFKKKKILPRQIKRTLLSDCAYNGEDGWISGCNGAWNPGYAYWLNGYWSESHNHTFTGDFASEAEYSYNAERGSCRTDYKAFYQGAKVSGLYVTSNGDEETMKALVAEHGAVQTTVGRVLHSHWSRNVEA